MRIGRRFRDCGFYGEKVESTKDQTQGIANIKPVSNITMEDAQAFWDDLFSHEIAVLPDEIVDPDGVDDLPDEISLSDLI